MSWVVDGALRQQVEAAKKEYQAAVANQDLSLAREKAGVCARLLRMLAGHYPNMSYARDAEQWERVATAIKEGRFKRPGQAKQEGAQTEEAGGEEAFDSYIESLISTSNVNWNDIGGLEDAKMMLRENVVIAVIERPETIRPERGILLFGPPGTGKTLLASAAASNLRATFFQAPADKVLSKYYGESSKLIAALYRVAWAKAEKNPSIIFIDEFDTLAISRDGEISEASRKTLGTLLGEIEGFRTARSNRLVLTLVTTNTPWALDEAILSRFPLRVYVRLPETKAIADIIRIQTRGLDISGLNLNALAEKCRQRFFSGRELASLCRQAMRHMVREENPNLQQLADMELAEIGKRKLKVRALRENDFAAAFGKIKSVLTPDRIKNYEDWADQFGSQ